MSEVDDTLKEMFDMFPKTAEMPTSEHWAARVKSNPVAEQMFINLAVQGASIKMILNGMKEIMSAIEENRAINRTVVEAKVEVKKEESHDIQF